MNNKKAQFQIYGLAIISVIALVFIAIFFLSSTFRFVIIGLALIVMAFVTYLSGKGVKKNNIRVGVFIGLLAVGFVLIFASGVMQTIAGKDFVVVPFFATIECERGLTSSFQATIPANGDWFYKGRGLPENTDAWNLMIKTPDYGLIGIGKRVEYYICNSKSFCSNRVVTDVNRRGDIINIGNIDANKYVWVQHAEPSFTGWKGISGATLDVTYNPFKLIRDDPLRGGRQEINTVGCNVPTSDIGWTKRIINFKGSSDIDEFTGDNKLVPGEIINYISGDIIAVKEGNTQSGGWCIYENGIANIYEIEEITYGYGTTINRVNLDNRLTTNECCNGESYINSICENGKLIPIEKAECSSRRDCGTLEYFAIDDNKIGRFNCVSGKCVIVDEKTVECTEKSDCKTNEFCSRNTFTCELSSEVGGEGEVTTTPEEMNESICSWYETEYTKTEKDYGALYWKAWTPFIKASETEVTGCKLSPLINLSAIIILVGGLGGFAIYTMRPKRKR